MMHLIVLACLALAAASAPQESASPQASVLGRLTHTGGRPLLTSEQTEVRLTSDREEIRRTLADERLAGMEFKVAGRFLAGGEFEVSDLFVARDGKLWRLVYFCETCNITTFAPGLCDCCREPTHPIVIPLNDPRVYHPRDAGPPGK